MTDRLLVLLRKRANHRGRVLVRAAVLASELACNGGELARALTELVRGDKVEIVSPPPFLILALKDVSWSGARSKASGNGLKSRASAPFTYSFQSSLSQSKLPKESYRSKVRDGILREILATLGESDPTTFRGAVENYPPAVIRTALERVRRMKHIRKNPTALFRFLLPRIAAEPGSKH